MSAGPHNYKFAVTTTIIQARAADLKHLELELNGDRTPQAHASSDTGAMSTEVPVSDRVRELWRRTAEYKASLERGQIGTGPLRAEANPSQKLSAAVRTTNAHACTHIRIECCIEQTIECPMGCCIALIHSIECCIDTLLKRLERHIMRTCTQEFRAT